MYLAALWLTDFRCYEAATLRFPPGGTVKDNVAVESIELSRTLVGINQGRARFSSRA